MRDYGYMNDIETCQLCIMLYVKSFFVLFTVFLQHGSWNPLLTKCLLNEHREKIFGGSSGCYLVGLLEESGHYAKTCGWKSKSKNLYTGNLKLFCKLQLAPKKSSFCLLIL